MPPAPPGYDPTTWKTNRWDYGRWLVKSPEGRIYTAHPEDIGHWRHWDIQGPGGKDEGSWPSNPDKPWPGQKKKLKPNQCDKDPSGDAPEWTPPVDFMLFFMPLDPMDVPMRIPMRVPMRIPLRIPIPAW
jgi:hypothetical protein